jgi:hypothetical protein
MIDIYDVRDEIDGENHRDLDTRLLHRLLSVFSLLVVLVVVGIPSSSSNC